MEENLPAQHGMLLYNQNIQQNYGIIIKLKAGLYIRQKTTGHVINY